MKEFEVLLVYFNRPTRNFSGTPKCNILLPSRRTREGKPYTYPESYNSRQWFSEGK